jgi:hypothetical protein
LHCTLVTIIFSVQASILCPNTFPAFWPTNFLILHLYPITHHHHSSTLIPWNQTQITSHPKPYWIQKPIPLNQTLIALTTHGQTKLESPIPVPDSLWNHFLDNL